MSLARWTSAAARLAAAALVACAVAPVTAEAQVGAPGALAFFSQENATPGVDVGLGITLANPNDTTLTGVGVSMTLPAGLVISTPSQLFSTCGGTATAADGGSQIALSGGTLPPVSEEDTNSCAVLVDVVAPGPGTVSVATGAPTSDEGGAGLPSAPASLQVLAQPTISESFDRSPILVGETARMTFTMTNPNGSARLYNLAFDDALPAGLVVASPANVGVTCETDGLVAEPGGATVSLLGLQVEAAAQCAISVDVTATAASTAPNSTGPLSFSYDGGGGDLRSATAPGASATLVVIGAPALTAAFAPPSIRLGATTALTFALANPNPALALTGVGFTAALSPGLVIATPSGVQGACGGAAITAIAGAGSIVTADATLPAAGSCTFSVDVRALAAGQHGATTSAVTSSEAGAGAAVSATLLVLPPPVVETPIARQPPPPPPPPPPLPSNSFRVTKFRAAGDGTARFDVTIPGAGDVLALGTLGSASARVRKPGPGRFTLARRIVHAKLATTLHVTLRPNARGRRTIRRLRRAGRMNVWISFRPTGGRAGPAVRRTVVLRPR